MQLKSATAVRRLSLVLLMLFLNAYGVAQENSANDSKAKSRPQITIERVRLQSRSTLETVNGQLELKLRVRATGNEPVKLLPSQFSLAYDERTSNANIAIVEPLFQGEVVIKPNEERAGWVGFMMQHPSQLEPSMRLKWSHGEDSMTINVNESARTSSEVTTKLMGPDDCLAVVSMKRNLDPLTVWMLTDEFKVLKQKNLSRVVVDLQPGKEPLSNSYSVRSALNSWMMSVQSGGAKPGFGFQHKVRSSIQFDHFFATSGQSMSRSRFYGTTVNIYRPDREQCIAAALSSVYETLPVTKALGDLQHEEAGVRRAVLEANIDRLDNNQLTELLSQLDDAPEGQQALIADNLYRVSSPLGSESLADMVRSSDRAVAEAALKSLVRSVNEESSNTIRTIWAEEEPGSLRRVEIAWAIMEVKDYRHLDLLTDFAREILYRAATNPSGESETEANNQKPAEASTAASLLEKLRARQGNRPSSKPTSETQALEKVLNFLKEHGEADLQEICRQQVLLIPNPVVQDVVINFLLARSSGNDDQLIHEYITNRLPGLSDESDEDLDKLIERLGPLVNQRFSQTLINTIRRYPAPEYAEPLFQLSRTPVVQSSTRSIAFNAALRCASAEKLDALINDFDSLVQNHKPLLMKRLALTRHPGWDKLLEQTLRGDETSLNIAMNVVRTDQSPEVTEILLAFTDETRTQFEKLAAEAVAGNEEDKDSTNKKDQESPPGSLVPPGPRTWPSNSQYRKLQRRLQIILPQLSLRTHPESRRILNRCHCSYDLQISKMAHSGIITMARSSPHWSSVVKAARLRRDKDYEAAAKVYSEIIEKDPFYSGSYVSRSSLHLRADRADSAMKDLKVAESLDPENPLIESLISITHVRLGNIEEGLNRSEEILKKVPDIATLVRRDAIYNAACAYGRAAERIEDAAVRRKYLDKGIDYLLKSIDRPEGFDEVDHALNDPDLTAFHDHPQWEPLLAKIRANEKKVKP